MYSQKALVKASAKIRAYADGNLSIESARNIMLNAYDGEDGGFGKFIDAVIDKANVKQTASGYKKI